MSFSSDLRASSVPRLRSRTRSEKYWGFRHIKPGQLNRPHYRIISSPPTRPLMPSGNFWYDEPISEATPVEIWNKQRMYIEAQQWPRPPKYHKSQLDKLDKRGVTGAYERRRYDSRALRRTLQGRAMQVRWVDDEGRRRSQEPTNYPCFEAILEWNYRKENEDEYELEAEEDECELEQILMHHREMAADRLVRCATVLDMKNEMVRMENDGWSLCDSEASSTYQEWEYEMV